MDRLKMMWLAYLTVSQAAICIRDPHEKKKMFERAARRLDAFFLELEKDPAIHDPVFVQFMRRGG